MMSSLVQPSKAAGKLTDRRPSRRLLCSWTLVSLIAFSAMAVFASSSLATSLLPGEFGVTKLKVSARNEDGTPDLQAGSHPYALTTTLTLNEAGPTTGDLKDLRFELPPGIVGNPDAIPKCTYQDFSEELVKGKASGCSNESVVGLATSYVIKARFPHVVYPSTSAVYNLVPPPGVAAEFGYVVLGTTPVLLQESVRTGGDYGVTTSVPDVNQATVVDASKVTLWGVPAQAVHDSWRGSCEIVEGGAEVNDETPGSGLREAGDEDEIEGPLYAEGGSVLGGLPESNGGNCEVGIPPKPLLTLPSSCGRPLTATVRVDSWEEPHGFETSEGPRTRSASLPQLTGCENLPFNPSLKIEPEKTTGSSPSGLDVEVALPQEGGETPTGLAEADVKNTTVTLPAGVQLNASPANGLQACSDAQVGYTGAKVLEPATEPGVTTPQFREKLLNPENGLEEADLCPPASKLGKVSIKSPLIEGELHGGIYLAAPQNDLAGLPENPFSSLLAMYLIAEEPETGVIVKLAGKVVPNETTGQLTTTFEGTPQLPFSTLHVDFFGGERAPLSTPSECGTYTATASFTPWSGTPTVPSSSAFNVSSNCANGPLPFAPSLAAESTNVNAAAFSPLSTSIGREDGQQALHDVSVTYPPGVSAVLTGVPQCGEAEANAGTCSTASQIGEDTASAGVGSQPVTITGGRVYLTGPYEGAPFGLSIVTPAVAGPFNLGNVVVRAKININPTTGAVTVTTTGAIPDILRGIPLEVKKINVTVNRPNFTINPTSCNPTSVTGTVGGWEGASFPVSTPFQVGNCQNLAFAPKFTVATAGHTSKALGAGLTAKVTEPVGALGTQANIARVKVDLPIQLPSQLKTLQKACLAKTFEEGFEKCLKESPEAKVGEAVVDTPLLPVPLTGPAIFVSHGNEAFPSLTMVLQGDGVTIDLVGSTLIHAGITSTTFKTVPDVPFTSFELTLAQGKYAALTSNLPEKDHGNLCGQNLKMPTEFIGQNGAAIHEDTAISISGCAKVKALTRAQKLQKALKACKKKAKDRRASCEKAARKAYGPVKKAKRGRK
jgi:hypothetical protein